MKCTRAIGIALAVAAVLACAAAVRLMMIQRLPDGTLALGLAVALGTSGMVLILIQRRMTRRGQRVLANRWR